MASWQIELKPSVDKDLRRMPRDVLARVLTQIEMLQENPHGPNSTKLRASEALYRIRVGDYRIIFELDQPNKLVIVHHVRHRRDVYRDI